MYLDSWNTRPSAAAINNILVPPKLSSGKVIPVKGKIPIIDATFRITCDANQPKTPAATNFNLMSIKWSITLRILKSNAVNSANITNRPTKPKVSPMIAKTESLIASGKYPVAWTLLPIPTPNKPPVPIAIFACSIW